MGTSGASPLFSLRQKGLLPQGRSPFCPGEEDPSAPGEEDPSAPGEEDPSAPGEEDPSAPGEEDPSASGFFTLLLAGFLPFCQRVFYLNAAALRFKTLVLSLSASVGVSSVYETEIALS
jgi:hypothetical protein